MSDNFTGARDLAGVPDEEEAYRGAAPPTRPRRSSPSPIRSKQHSESPAGPLPHTSAEAAAPPPVPPQEYHQEPLWSLPMHPQPSTSASDSAAMLQDRQALPPQHPQRRHSGSGAVATVAVPDLRGDTAAAVDASSRESPLMKPNKLLFSDGAAAAAAAAAPLTPASTPSRGGYDGREAFRSVRVSRTTSTVAGGHAGDPSRRTDGAATVLPSGKLQVRITRDGKTSVEEMEPNELAHLYAQQQAALQKMQSQFDFLTVPDWVRLHPMLGPYIAEATGTFAWVLTLSLTSIRNQSIFNMADDTNVTCLPIGFMFTSMVFTFGYISGGHFNPAISLAVFFVRRMDLARCLGYIICQIAAAFGAGVVAMLIQGDTDIFVPSVENSFVSSGIFAELIFTFAIAIVVLNTGYSRQSGNFFYGFAVGMTMAAGSASVGHISGGAFNPAAATGLQLSLCMTGSCDDLKSFWIYWLAPVVGAAAAALIFSQMYQPANTQILEDHKMLRDPAKHLMRSGRVDSDVESADGRGDDAARHATSRGSSYGSHDSSRHSSDADEVEMDERRHGGRAHVLNDSLTEPVVVAARGGVAAGKENDVTSLV